MAENSRYEGREGQERFREDYPFLERLNDLKRGRTQVFRLDYDCINRYCDHNSQIRAFGSHVPSPIIQLSIPSMGFYVKRTSGSRYDEAGLEVHEIPVQDKINIRDPNSLKGLFYLEKEDVIVTSLVSGKSTKKNGYCPGKSEGEIWAFNLPNSTLKKIQNRVTRYFLKDDYEGWTWGDTERLKEVDKLIVPPRSYEVIGRFSEPKSTGIDLYRGFLI